MPTLLSRTLLLALALWAALACAGERAGTDGQPLLAEAGADSFGKYCASCHGSDARGQGPAAAALRQAPADLTRIAARRDGEFPEAEIAGFIDGRFEVAAHGAREMPVWGRRFQRQLSPDSDPDEISRGILVVLVEYLKTIQRD